jgi:hypothetical protein
MATRKRTTARRIAGTEPLHTSAYEGASSTAEEEGRDGAHNNARDQAVDSIRKRLAHHVGDLRFITGVLGVCVQALNHQAADMDPEIAHLLQRVVGDELDKATDGIEAIALGVELEEA